MFAQQNKMIVKVAVIINKVYPRSLLSQCRAKTLGLRRGTEEV